MLQLLMLVLGLNTLIRADLPSWFIGEGYQIKGWPARTLGLLMISTVPLAALITAFLGFFAVPNYENIGFITELVIVVTVAIAVMVLSRKLRQPIESQSVGTDESTQD